MVNQEIKSLVIQKYVLEANALFQLNLKILKAHKMLIRMGVAQLIMIVVKGMFARTKLVLKVPIILSLLSHRHKQYLRLKLNQTNKSAVALIRNALMIILVLMVLAYVELEE